VTLAIEKAFVILNEVCERVTFIGTFTGARADAVDPAGAGLIAVWHLTRSLSLRSSNRHPELRGSKSAAGQTRALWLRLLPR